TGWLKSFAGIGAVNLVLHLFVVKWQKSLEDAVVEAALRQSHPVWEYGLAAVFMVLGVSLLALFLFLLINLFSLVRTPCPVCGEFPFPLSWKRWDGKCGSCGVDLTLPGK